MRTLLFQTWPQVLFLAVAVGAGGAEVMESSYRLPDGGRVLRHEVLVAGRVEEVWKLVSTSEGLQGFGATGDANDIGHEIVSFIPNQMLSIRIVNTPPGFPQPELAKKVFTVIELLPINDPMTTRVRISMLPYGNGPEWDEVYELFRAGNASVLKRLHDHLAK